MCLVAAGRLDAMLTLREVRSVDVAARQLIVTEAGGAVALPGGDALDLEMRSRVVAARSPSWSSAAGALAARRSPPPPSLLPSLPPSPPPSLPCPPPLFLPQRR